MKPQWDPHIQQLEGALEIYRAAVPRLPTSFPTSQGVLSPTEELTTFFEETFGLLKETNDRSDVNSVLLGIHQPGVLNPIATIVNSASNVSSNPLPQYLDQIAQHLWSIRASLVWLVPPSMQGIHADVDLQAQSAAVRGLSAELSKSVSRAAAEAALISSQLEAATTAVDEIKGHEREAATARINSETSATTAASNKELIATNLQTLLDGIAKQKSLQAAIEELGRKAQSTLESTSKVALAAAFSDRRGSLFWEKWGWLAAFILGIAGLSSVAFATQLGILNLPPIFKDNTLEIGPFLLRIFLVGPVVWFTWFAVRQYGNATRLIEDYAFKEASALAFVGYQREMSGDAEMIKLLRESAISNFGSQPTRIFDKAEPTSPAHELLTKAIDNGSMDKLIELLKSIKK